MNPRQAWADYLQAQEKPAKRQKFGNVKTAGFDSKHEAQVFHELKLREKAGEILDVRAQVEFTLNVNGYHIARYVADATYRDTAGALHVVDAKSPATRKIPTYVLKKKLLLATHGYEIEEL